MSQKEEEEEEVKLEPICQTHLHTTLETGSYKNRLIF
jgi:hypothetical protein